MTSDIPSWKDKFLAPNNTETAQSLLMQEVDALRKQESVLLNCVFESNKSLKQACEAMDLANKTIKDLTPPAGCALLPVEPTMDMIEAMVDVPTGAMKIPLDLLPHKPSGLDVAEAVYVGMVKHYLSKSTRG